MCVLKPLAGAAGFIGKNALRAGIFGLAGRALGGNTMDRRTTLDGRPLPPGSPSYGGMS